MLQALWAQQKPISQLDHAVRTRRSGSACIGSARISARGLALHSMAGGLPGDSGRVRAAGHDREYGHTHMLLALLTTLPCVTNFYADDPRIYQYRRK